MGKQQYTFCRPRSSSCQDGKRLLREISDGPGSFQKADDILGYDLSKIIFEGPEEELTRTEHAQPAIFLISWVAFSLLKELLSPVEAMRLQPA